MERVKKGNFPKISIIVPAYNEEKYIEECLRSLKYQTYPSEKKEIIVVDDGSTDTTKEKAKKWSDFIFSQIHQGPAVARNKGAEIAKGNILVFIDADMYVTHTYIETITKPIRENKADATFTKDEYIANGANVWAYCFQIDNNLPRESRIRPEQKDTDKKFRAIQKTRFINSGKYATNTGYGEDAILESNLALHVKDAVSYHYNPDTLQDVFLSARWMGRSRNVSKTFRNLLRYSLINSLLISLKKIRKGAPLRFVLYKIIFDFGYTCGILQKNEKGGYAK